MTIALLVGIVGPASAQFFNFGGLGGPRRARARRWRRRRLVRRRFLRAIPATGAERVYQDFSKAPPPEKRDAVPERNVLVMGDGMADWLAYGLEDAYVEQPDMGVIRKAKNTSGLIKYQPKGEPADWAAAAKGILATENPDVVVIMLGINDRVALREPASEKGDKDKDKEKSADKKNPKKDARGKPSDKPADNKSSDNKTAELQAGGQGRGQARRQGDRHRAR